MYPIRSTFARKDFKAGQTIVSLSNRKQKKSCTQKNISRKKNNIKDFVLKDKQKKLKNYSFIITSSFVKQRKKKSKISCKEKTFWEATIVEEKR